MASRLTIPAPQLIDLHPAATDLRRLVVAGMERQPRQLPAWLLYDDRGSQLFDAICEQPEYGLTRTETALLLQRAPELAEALGTGTLVEFGAGSARKVSPLLQELDPHAYVALDISSGHLRQACRALQQRHPTIPILGICCDYSQLEQLPAHPWLERRRLGFYPGSSIGNFTPDEAVALLRQFLKLLGPDSRLLIGIDQPKAVQRLEAAYNDQAGYSAAFALNLLSRLNRDLEGDFRPEAFHYRAWWQPEASRIAMALVSREPQTVTLAGQRWTFAADEPLITEYSVKYTPEAFRELARRAGWRSLRRWSDGDDDLSLHLLEPAERVSEPDRQPDSGQQDNER